MRSRPWRWWWRSAVGAGGERRPGLCVPLRHPYHRSGTARWRRGAALHQNTIPPCRGAAWRATIYFCPPASVALPGIIAAAIFAFTVSWAQFLYPLAFTTSADQLVLPVGIITSLIKGDVFNWGQIMTGALLGAAPPLVIYVFLMDYYIAGLTAGATKG